MKSRAKSGSVKQWLGMSALSFSALALLPMSIALAAEAVSNQAQQQFGLIEPAGVGRGVQGA